MRKLWRSATLRSVAVLGLSGVGFALANLVLAHQPPADQPKRRIAYTIVGQANFDLLNFAEAEQGFIAARALLPPDDKMHPDLTERIASAVYRQAEAKLPTRYGTGSIIAYGVKYESQEPLVFVMGDLTKSAAPLVRLHSSCFTGDLLESLRCDCGDQLHMALDMISREGCGVLVYLPQEGRGIGIIEKIKAYKLQDEGLDTVEANIALGYKADPRDYGVGIQLLKDLGLTRVRLLTNNPKKTDAFIYGGFDLEVVDQVPIVGPIHEHNAGYLAAKRDKMGHQLPHD